MGDAIQRIKNPAFAVPVFNQLTTEVIFYFRYYSLRVENGKGRVGGGGVSNAAGGGGGGGESSSETSSMAMRGKQGPPLHSFDARAAPTKGILKKASSNPQLTKLELEDLQVNGGGGR